MNNNTRTEPQAFAAILGAALLALAMLATPVSASSAGAGVGCTDTWARADASGDVQSSASAFMRGATTWYEGSGGAGFGYAHVYTEGTGGSDAWAYGEDSSGRSVEISCEYDAYTPPPGGGRGGGGGGSDDDCKAKSFDLGTTAQLKFSYSDLLCAVKLTRIQLNMASITYDEFHFHGLIWAAEMPDGNYEFGAFDPTTGLGITAQDGAFVISSAADFAATAVPERTEIVPFVLQYQVAELADSVVIVGSIGPT